MQDHPAIQNPWPWTLYAGGRCFFSHQPSLSWPNLLSAWVFHKLQEVNTHVTLCRRSAKQMIPLSVLAWNQIKGLDLRSRRDRKWVREREWELDKGTQRRQLAKGDASGQSTSDSRGDWSAWEGVQSSEGRPVKMSQHSSWVVEFSLEIHASVSLHMHRGIQCYITPLLALWINPSSYCSFVLSSHSLDCISWSHE